MSRPARYSGKRENSSAVEKSSLSSTDPAAASALSKARAQFNQPLVQLQAIFPEWKEEDLISVLEEVKGDIETAVARISEGHAEQWGAVKHKKDKKPAPGRERDRDTQSHSTVRGSSSPRGRGRGGRGSNIHPTGSRQHRERNTNGVSSTPPMTQVTEISTEAGNASAAPEAPAADNQGPTGDAPDDFKLARSAEASLDAPTNRKEKQKSAAQPPPPNIEIAKSSSTQSAANLPKIPSKSGLSWAQVAKPSQKHSAQQLPDSLSKQPPASSVSKQHPTSISPSGREEPTTIEPHVWEDEPPSEAPVVPPVGRPMDGWVAATTEQSSPLPPSAPSPEPESLHPTSLPEHRASSPAIVSSVDIAPPKQDVVSPPPGLTNPAPPPPNPLKPSTPINVRPGLGLHRPSSRFKTDQPVVMPPQSLPAATTYGISGQLPLQFGSLSLSGDDENQSPSFDGQAQNPLADTSIDSKPATAPHSMNSIANHTTDVSQPAQISNSPVNGYRTQSQPPEIARESPPQLIASQSNSTSASGHGQSPAVTTALVHAPSPSPAVSALQPQNLPSQHGLAGLAHAPQPAAPPGGANHSQHPSYGQPGSFPLQPQQYESNNPPPMANPSLSNLGQLSQSQGQGFLRQQDSPFYNQSQNHDHGYGAGNTTFNQLGQNIQSGFGGGPSLTNDFGYEGQRNAYDTYSGPNSFTGRGVHRQDDLKALANASNPGHGMPPQSHGQASQLGNGQSSGGQGQYPGISPMGNPFYYNMNPYPYGNQFYSPAFSPFVNPMYQAGGTQTPPHGSKPGNMGGSSGIPGTSVNTYSSSNNPGHVHHTSGGFDGDSTVGGTPTYHQPSNLPADFPKGNYGGGQGMGFLGNVNAATGVAINRGPNAASTTTTTSPDATYKGYGVAAGPSAGLVTPDKAGSNQSGRGVPNTNTLPQQFYQNPRFSANQGVYPQQQQQQPQNDGYYGNYQRW